MTLTVEDYLPELTRAQIGETTHLLGELDDFKGHWRRVAEVRAERLAQLRQPLNQQRAPLESKASSSVMPRSRGFWKDFTWTRFALVTSRRSEATESC
jgi:hypothetical protein